MKLTSVLLLTTLLSACSQYWPAFRHDRLRTAGQLHPSALSNPTRVASLHVAWTFNDPHGGALFIVRLPATRPTVIARRAAHA